MSKAVIFALDDDSAVLNAVERDLRQKYGRQYRVINQIRAGRRWEYYRSSKSGARRWRCLW